MPLTDTQIRSFKPSTKPTKKTDGAGLYLEIRPSGSKLWRYRYRIAGKENVFAAGEYAQAKNGEGPLEAEQRRHAGRLTLAEARIQRESWRAMVKQGVHPSHHRQTERLSVFSAHANTFETVAREWIAKKREGWSPYYARQVDRFMASDVFPYIGHQPIRSVTAAHLLEVMRRTEQRGAKTVALLVRQWSSAIFRYAVATLRAEGDPAAALKGVVVRPKVKHHKPLTREEIIFFLNALHSYGGYRSTVIALRLMLLTFVRTVELRAACWQEIDFARAEWRIPAERMKKREPHIVPLAKQSLVLFKELHTFTGGRDFLFPNHRSPRSCMTATTLNRALERMGLNGKETIGFSAHGFRATASTLLNEMSFRADVIERQLAHSDRNKVRASYNQAEYMEERRAMMQLWADYIDELATNAGLNGVL